MRKELHSGFVLTNAVTKNLSDYLMTRVSTRNNFLSSVLITAAVLLLITPTVNFSQTVSSYSTDSNTPASLATGAPAGSYSISDIENVSLFSGNLNVTLPLIKIGGRGSAGYTISLPFEHRWRIQDAYYPSGTYSGGPPPASAYAHHYYPEANWWTEGAGFGPGIMRSRRNSTFIGDCPGNSSTTYGGGQILTQLTFSGPNGTELNFFDRQTGGTPAVYTAAHGCNVTPAGAYRGNIWVTGDGSNVVFVADANFVESPGTYVPSIGYPSGDMYFSDGTHYRIDSGKVSYINDRNGNKISFSDSLQNGLSVTDSLGRVLSNLPSVNSGYGSSYPKTITFPGVGGVSRTIEIGGDSIGNVLRSGYTLKGNNDLFSELGADVQNQTTPQNYTVVSYVKLPNNKQYNFKYDSYGDIARIELPTGGAIEYDWSGVATTGCGAKIQRWVTERRVYPDGGTGTGYESKTTYAYGGTKPGILAIVTAYSGSTPLSVTKHYFNPEGPQCTYNSQNVDYTLPTGQIGREYQTESYSADGTTLLRKVVTEFENRAMTTTASGTKYVDYRPIRITSTLADVSPNLISKTEFGYDPNVDFTRQTDVSEFDYGSGGQVGTSLKQRTHTDYLSVNSTNSIDYTSNTIHLLNLPTQTWVSSDAAGTNKLSLTKYEYDNYGSDSQHAGLTARDDIIGHLRTANQNSFNTLYTSRGNLTKVTSFKDASNESAGSVSTASQFDIAGNIVKKIDARIHSSTINYDDNFGLADGNARLNTAPSQLSGKQTYAFATSAVNPLQFTVYAQFDYSTGLLVNAEDANGVVSKQLYADSLERPTQTVTAVGTALEQQTTIGYDDNAHEVTKTSDFNALNDNTLKTKSRYDGLGRTFESRRYESDGTYTATQTIFDGLGRPSQISNPFKQNTAATDLRWTKKFYDALGRVYKVILPDDTPTTDADNSTVLTGYSGNVKTVTDQAGKKRTGISNALGQTTQVIEDPDGQNLTTDYTFDAAGNLRKTVQGAQSRYFLYDSLGRVTRARQPEQGVNASFNLTDSITSNSQWSVSYSYDDNGNITTTTDARGVSVTGIYDDLNRLTSRDYSDSTPDVAFTYDMTTIQGTAVNYKGGLTKIVTGDPNAPFSVTYNSAVDVLGRIKASQQKTEGITYNFPDYSYNLAGALKSETYPSGKVVNSEYETDSDLSRLTVQSNVNTGARLYASAFSYTPAGAVKSMRLGNGRWESAQFNDRLQTTQIGLGNADTDTSLLKLELNYGTNNQNNSSVREQKISFSGLAQPIVQTYGYDSLNRLQSAIETNQGNATTIWKETFSYDRYGNRSFDELNTTTIQLGCTTGTQNPNGVCNKDVVNPRFKSDNRFDDGQTYEYDPAGNLTKDANGKSFAYDAENHQKGFGTNNSTTNGGQYYYDGQGKRVKTSVPSQSGNVDTIFIYDAFGKLVAEYNNLSPVATPKTNYLTVDHLGTPRIITDGLGAIVSRHDYRAFGEEIIAGVGSRTTGNQYSSPDIARQQYTGYERDYESGLDYAQARYYNSKQGRFTSVDPLTASATIRNPQTFNRYSYALNSPYKFTDPLGLSADPCGLNTEAACKEKTEVQGNTEVENSKTEETESTNNSDRKSGTVIGVRMIVGGTTFAGEVDAFGNASVRINPDNLSESEQTALFENQADFKVEVDIKFDKAETVPRDTKFTETTQVGRPSTVDKPGKMSTADFRDNDTSRVSANGENNNLQVRNEGAVKFSSEKPTVYTARFSARFHDDNPSNSNSLRLNVVTERKDQSGYDRQSIGIKLYVRSK